MHPLQTVCALAAVLLAFALFVSILLLLGTLAMKALRKGRRGALRVSHLSGLLIASALLGFQNIVHPHVRHEIVLEMKEHDDSGDDRAPCGGPCFHRQLRRLRHGELVEDLKVIREDV
jgi:hypothetical protein